jgi:transcriptional regulator with PAS, ATPase and Fis domain
MTALCQCDWPGNVRELQNVLAALLVSSPERGIVGVRQLPSPVVRVAALGDGASLARARREFEIRFVRAALARANGRQALAARDLGVSRQGLSKLMARLGLLEEWRSGATMRACVAIAPADSS